MSLEKLAEAHAYWADKVRELKQAGVEAADKCTSLTNEPPLAPYGKTCIELVFHEWKSSLTGYPGEDSEFEEHWVDAVYEGDVCVHCQNVRRLKAERMKARRRLGNVRAAITRIGRRLAEEATS